MKTTIEVGFFLVGINHADNHALNVNEDVQNARDQICAELMNKANAATPALEWTGNYPFSNEEKVEYEEKVQHLLGLASLEIVSKEVTSVLNHYLNEAVANIQKYLPLKTSEHSPAIVAQISPPKYDLKSDGEELWVKTPTGEHIIYTSAFTRVPSKQLVLPINEFNFTVNCSIKFTLGE